MAQVIYKWQHGSGYAYTGMLFAPGQEDSVHVLSLVCGERDDIGSREAIVSAKLAQEGKLELGMFDHPDEKGAIGQVKGWFQDPYDPDYTGPVLRTIADDEAYDAILPNHPLSRMRRTLSQLRQSARLAP